MGCFFVKKGQGIRKTATHEKKITMNNKSFSVMQGKMYNEISAERHGSKMINYGLRRGVRGVCACALSAVLLSGCGQAAEDDAIVVIEHEEEAIAYSYGVAEKGEVVKTERISCTYKQLNEQEVSFSVSGKMIDQIYVKEGDTVTKGTLLADLSSESLEREISNLEYYIARNELQLEFIDVNESLDISKLWLPYVHAGYVPTESLENSSEQIQKNYRYQREDSQDALLADREKLAALKAELAASRVYAQMDGIVYKLQDRLTGATSKQGEVIMTIIDTSECLFETSNPQMKEMISNYGEGETITMSVAYGSGAGSYELTPWNVEEWEEAQLFSVFTAPEGSEIEVGTTGTMYVVTGKETNVLCVPVGAVHYAGEKAFVYVLGADNMREMKWVETGLVGDSTVEIISGLAEGEKVILK